MKIDKDNLTKQRFWIALGGFALCWFIAFVTIRVSSGSQRKTENEAYDKAQKAIGAYFTAGPDKKPNFKSPNAALRPKNASFLPPWEAYGKNFRDQKDVAWQAAWEQQKGLLVFGSDSLNKRWEKDSSSFEEWRDKFDLTSKELSDDLSRYVDNRYLEQFTRLEPNLREGRGKPEDGLLYPAEYRAAGAGGPKGGFELMMAPAVAASSGGGETGGAPKGPGAAPGTGDAAQRSIVGFWLQKPSDEELFIAQEDFCVKAELLRCLRRSMDSVARLDEGPGGFWQRGGALVAPVADPPDGLRRVFHNANWELTLLFEKEGGQWFISKDSVIRNVNVSGKTLLVSNPTTRGPLEFRLKQGGSDKVLQLKGERLAWGQKAFFGDRFTCDVIDPNQAFTVDQLFDWSTAPVRRLDGIWVPALGHRMANVPLKPNPGFKSPEEKQAAEQAAQQQQGQQGQTGQTGGEPAPAASNRTSTMTRNNLAINRYMSVTDQSRHLPFALVVIVDQANVEDVLTALSNSPLRVQIMQVNYQRVRGLKSQLAQPASGDNRTGEGRTGDVRPGQPRGPGGTGTGMGNAELQGDDGDSNLVELSIYGVAALYQRYTPPK